MKKTVLALCVASVSFGSVADSSAYIGLNVGQSSLKDQKDVGAGAYLGANLLSFLAVELGFQGHGKNEYDWEDIQVYQESTQTDSFYFALKPQVTVGPVQLYAKLGRHAWSQDREIKVFGEKWDKTTTESGYGYMYGIGADYFFSEGLSAGLLAQKYQTKYGDVQHIGVNFTLHFM